MFAIDWLSSPEAWLALVTLVGLEVVLGIDNIVFISILVSRLPEGQREKARQLGIGLAVVFRLVLLACIAWIIGLVEPLFTILDNPFSGRDLIMIGGGLFLLAKATTEIHVSLEHVEPQHSGAAGAKGAFAAIIVQIALLDMVFSLDSVLTAVGLVDHLSIMAIAIIISMIVMLVAARAIGEFVEQNPTVKMLALSFLMLIGFTLVAEGLGAHVPKGYIYVAVVFSMFVEGLNIAARRRRQTEKLQLYRKNL